MQGSVKFWCNLTFYTIENCKDEIPKARSGDGKTFY